MEYRKEFEKEAGLKLYNGDIITTAQRMAYFVRYSEWLESKLTEQREKIEQKINQIQNDINSLNKDHFTNRYAIVQKQKILNVLTSLKQQD